MQKWEYKILDSDRIYEREFNELGEQGWELVGATMNDTFSYFIFKRPKV